MLLREHDSIPRNRKIADAFFYTGLIERWGSGTIRIASELQAAGLPMPQFKSDGGFQVVFSRELLAKDQFENMGLSERQIRAVEYLKEHKTISNTSYQEILDTSKRTASRELNELVQKGILISEGEEAGVEG